MRRNLEPWMKQTLNALNLKGSKALLSKNQTHMSENAANQHTNSYTKRRNNDIKKANMLRI